LSNPTKGRPPPPPAAPALAPHPGAAIRIHAVAALTGVPEPTLRAWERRYGVPAPERTTGNYRLYSRFDIEQVRAMRRLCDEGASAAEAARQVIETPPDELAYPSDADGAGESTESVAAASFAGAVEALTSAIRRLDDLTFEAQLRRASYLGSATAIFERVLVPTLHKVNSLLCNGSISIAHEHFASQRIATLIRDFTRLATPDDPKGVAVVACFADEHHEIGALGVALKLATWGLRPIFLGARTPPPAIHTAVGVLVPKLVALSVTVPPDRARARELVDGYAGACGPTPWAVGGPATETMADLVQNAGGIIAPPNTAGLRALVRSLTRPRRSDRGSSLSSTL
jgi:DNA-binding transcriptional MerR regulator